MDIREAPSFYWGSILELILKKNWIYYNYFRFCFGYHVIWKLFNELENINWNRKEEEIKPTNLTIAERTVLREG